MERMDEEFLRDIGGGVSVQGEVKISNCRKNCNVRARPDENSEIIGHAGLGKQFTFLGWAGIAEDWAKVLFQNRIAYIHSKFIETVE